MVDTQDLKSCDHYGCAGSSPAPSTIYVFKRLIIIGFSSVFVFRATLGATNDEVFIYPHQKEVPFL